MRYCTDILRHLALLAALALGAPLRAQEQPAGLVLYRLDDAVEAAARLDRSILLLLLDPASPLAGELAGDAARKALTSHVVVRVDAVAEPTMADRYMVRELPAALVLDGNGRVRARREGLRASAALDSLSLSTAVAGSRAGPTCLDSWPRSVPRHSRRTAGSGWPWLSAATVDARRSAKRS